MVVAKFLFLAATLSVANCASAQPKFDALMERLDERDACIAVVAKELTILHQRELAATDVQSFVSSVLGSFSPNVRDIFVRAAAAAIDDIRADGREDGDKRALMVHLHDVTHKTFVAQFHPEIVNCGSAATEILPNFIYRYQHLDQLPMSKRFARIGLTDSFSVEQAVLLMLVVEASGVEWQPDWFSTIAVRN